ncbi:MAG: PH domain-containing protein [Chitinophagaceae bacterium]
MKEQAIDWSIPQRQSPAAVFVVIVKVLLQLLKAAWPLILIYFLRSPSKRGNTLEIIIIGISSLAIIKALIELYFFRFSIVNNELIIKKGFFTKETIVLPISKIQVVHIDKTWIHNLFNTGQVSFDSAGSEKIEIKINAIQLKKAEALKEFVTGSMQQSAEQSVKRSDEVILSLGIKDLLKLCISANHLEAFFILLAFGFSVFNNIEEVTGDTKGFWQWLIEFTQGSSGKMLLTLAIAIMLISVMISVVRILLLYADFRISRSERGFHIHTGMINVKEKLVPFKKVQYISWKANWVRQKINFYLLNFHATGSEKVKNKQQVKVPVTRKEFIPKLVEFYHALLPVGELSALRIQRAYIFRKTLLTGIIPSIVLGAICFPFIHYYSLLLLLMIPLTAFHSWLFHKKFRLWADKDVVQVKKGIYGVEELIMKWSNIQKTKLQQSPYQRQKQLATLKIYTAGGTVVIPYITYRQAIQIMNYALYKVETDPASWM